MNENSSIFDTDLNLDQCFSYSQESCHTQFKTNSAQNHMDCLK